MRTMIFFYSMVFAMLFCMSGDVHGAFTQYHANSTPPIVIPKSHLSAAMHAQALKAPASGAAVPVGSASSSAGMSTQGDSDTSCDEGDDVEIIHLSPDRNGKRFPPSPSLRSLEFLDKRASTPTNRALPACDKISALFTVIHKLSYSTPSEQSSVYVEVIYKLNALASEMEINDKYLQNLQGDGVGVSSQINSNFALGLKHIDNNQLLRLLKEKESLSIGYFTWIMSDAEIENRCSALRDSLLVKLVGMRAQIKRVFGEHLPMLLPLDAFLKWASWQPLAAFA